MSAVAGDRRRRATTRMIQRNLDLQHAFLQAKSSKIARFSHTKTRLMGETAKITQFRTQRETKCHNNVLRQSRQGILK